MTTTPTLQMIDPATLVIDTNVRLDATTAKTFVASIKQHGVLQPIVGHTHEDGTVHVRMGQRRTLAAVEVGLDTVPVVVLPAQASDDDATRIIEQLAENDHRAAITDKDRVMAVDALTGLGLSAAQIQRRTNRPKAEVEAALAVNATPTAREAVQAATLTLEQGAVLAEFADDEEATAALMRAAEGGHGFGHKAQRLRDDRARSAAHDREAQALAGAGVKVIIPPNYVDKGEHPKARRVDELVTIDGKSDVDPSEHAACPGHAAEVKAWRDEQAEGGYSAVVTYYCTDPKINGHRPRFEDTNAKKSRDEMTEAEREQAKAERRELIANNKAWESAETVRLAWLADWLTRKTAPKETAAFIATAINNGAWEGAEPTDAKAREVMRALKISTSTATLAKASAGRALVLVLAGYLAAYEAKTDRNDWRSPKTSTREYLRFLSTNGYDLSEVEQLATKKK